ncbi:MAG: O-antigen ligase family protein [Solirubrobacteraceae bacterium]
MAVSLLRLRDERVGWVVALLVVCAGVGFVAGLSPMLGLTVAFGLAFAVATIADLTAGVVFFVFLSFLEVITTGSGATITKLAGLVLFGSWFAANTRTQARSTGARPALYTTLTVACVALLGWSAISTTWAESAGTALSSTERYGLNILLIPIVVAAVRRREHVVWILTAFVAGAVFSTVDGFLTSTSASNGGFGRLTGTVGDPNELAAVLVAAIPICLALAGPLRARPVLRAVTLGAALLCLAGTINTLSRGGLLALGAVLGAAVLFGGRWRPQATALLVVTALATVGYFGVIAPLAAQQRVTSADSSGRTDIWTVGWRMVKAHPLNGVGSGNFQNAEVHYLQAPGTISKNGADLIVNVPHVAHNIYLELLADLGIPGLLAFLGVVAAAIAATIKAARLFNRQGDREMELIARSMFLVLVGFMTADVFLSGEFAKQLWIAFGVSAALLKLAYAASRPTAAAGLPRVRNS